MTDSKKTEMGGTGWPKFSAPPDEKPKAASDIPSVLARGFRRKGDRSQPPMSLPILPSPVRPSPLAQVPIAHAAAEPPVQSPEVPAEVPADPWKFDYTHWVSLFLMVAFIAFVFVLLLSLIFWLVATLRSR